MTRIAYASDLHLEFHKLEILNTNDSDVLVLAGDICVARDFLYLEIENPSKSIRQRQETAIEYLEFFDGVNKQFNKVVYLMGNHEHYSGDIQTTRDTLEKYLAPYKNIQIIEDEFVEFDDCVIVGGTLWTDMRKSDPQVMNLMNMGFSDFTEISNSANGVRYNVPDGKGGRKTKIRPAFFRAEEAVKKFDDTLAYIDLIARAFPAKEIIVVTHHAPSSSSSLKMYLGSDINPGFYSDLDLHIMDMPANVSTWVHGHCHNISDYIIGITNILCNPRGYITNKNQISYFELKYIDIASK